MLRKFWRVQAFVLLGLVNGYFALSHAQSPSAVTPPTPQASAETPTQDTENSANDNSLQIKADLGYSSVFDNYIPYDQLPEISWKEANDLVGDIGGWRSYGNMVQEAQEKDRQREQTDGGGR